MIFEKQIVNTYKNMMYSRCDEQKSVFYFSPEDFEGLKWEKYPFKSSMGHTLRGYIYYCDGHLENRLVVFDHGFGGGHRAYMKEIAYLCKNGYRVFAYDHTGCMESGGESANGLAQSLRDLNDCINEIKSNERFAKKDISVMGHSWGAFSTLNITALHPDVTHTVALCGFVSVYDMICTFFSGVVKGYRKAVFELEKQTNPYFSKFNAISSLKESNASSLLIYSENDRLCRKSHYDMLKNALGDKENVRFMLVKNKGHNPNYTESAVKYLEEFSTARAKLLKNKKATDTDFASFVASFDWDRMTEQDENVWAEILKHLENGASR